MADFEYTVTTDKSVDAAVAAVEKAAQDSNFRVLYVHDVDGTLREKGFERASYKIVEVCSAKYASEMLNTDIGVGLFLPCKVNVYTLGNQTHISGLRPSIIGKMFDNEKIRATAAEVEGIICAIIDASK